jgi:hypothetical protein
MTPLSSVQAATHIQKGWQRQRPWHLVDHKLWCENRCEYLRDNNDQDSVTFLSANVDNLVLMRRFNQNFLASSIYNLCNTCEESTFKVTRSADVILTGYRHDLMDGCDVTRP